MLFRSYLTSPLTEQQYQQYYCGFANNALWPAMHDRSDLIEYSTDEYLTYQEVNRMFAEQLQAIAEPDDVIWVHDYHFFSIARHCRQLGIVGKATVILLVLLFSLSRKTDQAARYDNSLYNAAVPCLVFFKIQPDISCRTCLDATACCPVQTGPEYI